MNEVKLFSNSDDLVTALAQNICALATKAISDRGRFNFVLSGGSSPRKLYELLASDIFRDKIDWRRCFFFFGDERFVPEDDERKNFNMANAALFKPLNIKDSQVFEIDTQGSPESCAEAYSETIRKHFGSKPAAFDFVLLGLGDNVHTASLFPNTSVLTEQKATVKSVFVAEVDMDRITMTAPLINQARNISFLVYGEDKAEAVFHALEDESGTSAQFPARLIKNDQGKVDWYLDTAAASKLKRNY